MIDIGELEQATGLFNRLPDSEKESEFGRALIGQLSFMELASNTAGKEALISHLASNETDQDARFDLAICYIAAHQYELAAEALFNIMKVEPEYKDGAAREMIGNLANMLSASSPELSAVIRRQLANLMAP
ncbi:MAG: tetratricopeptide repeat protein, partial [Gammaproteobacteria bacterium]|nr:tetratricopeptide repeat protein [Gammaproteobacteria bacterium]